MKPITFASLFAVLATSTHAVPAIPGIDTKVLAPWVEWADGNDCAGAGQGALLTRGRCMTVPGAVAIFGKTRKNGMQVSSLLEDTHLNCDLVFFNDGLCFGAVAHRQPVTKQKECFDVTQFGSVQTDCTKLLSAVRGRAGVPAEV